MLDAGCWILDARNRILISNILSPTSLTCLSAPDSHPVRPVLFNWLFAKGQGGQFILRIDDTDAQRNVEEALAPILHGLKWVGLEWDEGPQVGGPFGPYYQSQRLDKYHAAVERL